MTPNDQLYGFLKAVYDQVTPERVYSWIKADSNGRGILRRMDYAYGFSQEKHPELKTYKEDENPDGFLNILYNVVNSKGVKYCDVEERKIAEKITYLTEVCKTIKEILGKFLVADYRGLNNLQKFVFKECFEKMNKVSLSATSILPQGTILYRLRKMEHPQRKQPLDLYHIPFTKRYLMGTYRYSIPGYPSLYTSSSVYCSWEEMNRSNIADCGFIAFKTKQEIQLLDFCWRFKEDLKNDFEELNSYICKLPFLIACSMHIRHTRDKFVPEYIFPQLVFKWLMDKMQMTHKRTKGIESTLGVMYTSNTQNVWKEVLSNAKCAPKIGFEDITNFALLAYLPIDGDFNQYSYDLGEKLYIATPYWVKEQPSARECAYDTLKTIQRHFENPRLKWRDLGEEIKRVERNIENN